MQKYCNMENVKKFVPILSKLTYKKHESAISGKRVFSDLTKSRYTSVDFYYKPICKF